MLRYFSRDRFLPFLSGSLMTANFIAFWSVPIFAMGNLYKFALKPYLQPVYLAIEGNSYLRSFAANYIYIRPEHADFFALSMLLIINCMISIPTVFYWQFTAGYLPWWLLFFYYCSWVGIGGSMMGAAYGLAHKEGHAKLYKPELAKYIGNLFENSLGMFFGNVPWNFTTSHIKIHHGVNGGIGDTFYLWDFDRTSIGDFMLYVHRILMHMTGYSSVKYFKCNGMKKQADQLESGIYTYITFCVGILAITRSLSFLFWIVLQPLFCMTYFLALINVGFHGFLEYDNKGQHIKVVDSTAIIDGSDDLWGEDDHMAHHYHGNVYYRDLPAHQSSKKDEFTKHKASVFHTVSIVELSIFILFQLWDELAKYYVDYSGKMTKEEIIEMLKVRAKRVETSYEEYQQYLIEPTLESRNKLRLNVAAAKEEETSNKDSDKNDDNSMKADESTK